MMMIFLKFEFIITCRFHGNLNEVVIQIGAAPIYGNLIKIPIYLRHLVCTVPLVTMQPIYDDKKKSNGRRLVRMSP